MSTNLWQAVKSYEINMSELSEINANDSLTFSSNYIASSSNVDLYSRNELKVFDSLFVKKEYLVSKQSLYKSRVATSI